MAQAYASLSSYEDEGVVVTTYDQKVGGWVENQPFKMFYMRPQFFRFEWIDYTVRKDGESRIVWSDGKNAFIYWQPLRYETSKSLALAVASATGISGAAAHTIPRLLMDNIGGISLADLTNVTMIGDGKFEDEVCYIIKGNLPIGVPVEVWISNKSYLVRKITDDMVRRLVKAAERIKRVFGGKDQDIEWIYMRGQIYIVQARPFIA